MVTKKILITTGVYPPELGGPATYTALMEKELPKHGIEVDVLPFRTVRKYPKIIRHFIFFCKVITRGRKCSLLYAQDPVSVGLPTVLASKVLRKPFLIRIAGDYAWEQAAQRFGVKDTIDEFQNKKYRFGIEIFKHIQSFVVRNANKVITPSRYFKQLVGGWNRQVDNVITIYNGIDLSEVQRGGDSFESKTIISAGRLLPWKGFDFLIRLLNKLPEWKLYIAGDGPEYQNLNKIIVENGLEKRAFLLGSLNRSDLINKIQKCEVFILNTTFESFSFVVVEAMAAQVPVITTNVGNLAEIVDDKQNGILVEPNNEIEYLQAINKMSDLDYRNKIAHAAKEKTQEFSIDRTVTKTAELIHNLTHKTV